MAEKKKSDTDTIAIEGPAKARSTFITEPTGDESTLDEMMSNTSVQDAAREVREQIESEFEQDNGGTAQPHVHFEEPLPRRRSILDEADEKIMRDRRAEYGDVQESFERTAALWTARDLHIGGRVYTASDVAQMLALLKISRIAGLPSHADSWIDLAGYAALGAEVSDA